MAHDDVRFHGDHYHMFACLDSLVGMDNASFDVSCGLDHHVNVAVEYGVGCRRDNGNISADGIIHATGIIHFGYHFKIGTTEP